MTNANVMALNVQPAAQVKSGKGMPGSVADGSSKGNFDEALGRLQQEAQKELTSAGKDDTSQDMDARDGGSGREGAPHSPLAMVMALPLQQPVAEEVQTEAPAAVAEFSKDAPVSEALIEVSQDLSTSEAISGKNLHSLLPQSDETAVKNRDFLAMLSGELTSGQKAEARGRLELPLQGPKEAAIPKGVEAPNNAELQTAMPAVGKQPGQNVEARPLASWQVGQPLANVEPKDPLGLALRQAAMPQQREVQLEVEPAPQNTGQPALEPVAEMAQPLQPRMSAALRAEVLPQAVVAAEPVLQNGNEKLHVIFGNNLEIKAEPENQPVQVMQNPGEAPFKEGQQHDSSPRTPQLEFVKVPENEEAAEPVQAAMVSQSTGAVQVNAFQQQLETVLPVKNAEIPEVPEVPLQAGTDYEVPGQIVEQARLIRSGENTEMVIHLKPEHLGDLTLKISVAENGAVTASFHSDNVFVRTIIENSLVQLRQELNDQGLKVDSVEVFSGLQDGQLPQGQGQQAWQQGFQGRSAGGNRTPEEYAEDADDLAAAAAAQSQESVTEDGVDYRI